MEQKRALSPTFVWQLPFKIYISNEQLLYQFLVAEKVILSKNQPPSSSLGVSRHMGEGTGTLALSPEALLVKCPWNTMKPPQSKWLKWFLVRVRAR